ncbi:hypothetical protein, partial [Nocardia carnea]|uniref:hypothetical protein n=1 Tax=Nocardia carnea TaxID=37328 RepID=UPI003D7A957D
RWLDTVAGLLDHVNRCDGLLTMSTPARWRQPSIRIVYDLIADACTDPDGATYRAESGATRNTRSSGDATSRPGINHHTCSNATCSTAKAPSAECVQVEWDVTAKNY